MGNPIDDTQRTGTSKTFLEGLRGLMRQFGQAQKFDQDGLKTLSL